VARQVSEKLAEGLSAELRRGSGALFKEIESLNERIQEYDERRWRNRQASVPGSVLAQAGEGVGTQIALTYVLR